MGGTKAFDLGWCFNAIICNLVSAVVDESHNIYAKTCLVLAIDLLSRLPMGCSF